MKLSRLAGRRVWITGGSTGIGFNMALVAAEVAAHLVLFSSRPGPLAEAAKLCREAGAASVRYRAVDVGVMTEAATAAKEMAEEAGHPEFLILNAGISQRTQAAHTEFADTERIMAVNFLGAVAFAKTLLPGMIAAGGGKIAVTSSLVGIHGFFLRSSYSASKHALHGYFESLYLEYRDRGIGVTMAIGGRIKTHIGPRSVADGGEPPTAMDPAQEKGVDPWKIATRYWRAVLKGRREVLLGGAEVISVPIRRYLPWIFFHFIGKASPT